MFKNNKKINTYLKNPTWQVIFLIIFLCSFWEFIIMIILKEIHLTNLLVEAVIDTFSLSVLTSLSFWWLYFRPRWKTERKEQSFIDQQMQGLNKLAIISATDRKGNIIYANDNFCRISGYSREELIGQNHRINKSDFHPREFYESLWKILVSGETWRGEIKNKNRFGEDYWVYATIIPLMNEETKKIDQFISFRFDITNEKNLESQLEVEQEKNIHMGRLSVLGEMAGSIAHEINNPIAIILGKIHILKRMLEQIENSSLKESILKDINSINDQSKRVSKIVRGLKEFTYGGSSDSYEEIKSEVLIESTLDLCTEKIKFNQVIVKSHIDSLTFTSNKLQLEQVLVNLINNAVDAIAHLEEKWIELTLFERDGFINLSVVDSGNGIPSEIVYKIMLPFFTTKPMHKGTGLGLSISKGIIEKLGGSFEYDSSSKNTRFIIKMPKDDNAIMHSLSLTSAIERTNEIYLKINHFLEHQNEYFNEKEFMFKDENHILKAWITRYGARLAKNGEYIELKAHYDDFNRISLEILLRMKNKDSFNPKELSVESLKLKDSFQALCRNLSFLENKYR